MLRTLSHFYNLFRGKSQAQNKPIENNLVIKDKYAIILSRDNNNQTKLDVVYNVDLNHSESIVKNAETLAEMIVYLTSNSFQKTILSQLSDKYDQTDEITDKIFIDNIIAFYGAIKQDISSANKSKFPVMRPLSVFNTK